MLEAGRARDLPGAHLPRLFIPRDDRLGLGPTGRGSEDNELAPAFLLLSWKDSARPLLFSQDFLRASKLANAWI